MSSCWLVFSYFPGPSVPFTVRHSYRNSKFVRSEIQKIDAVSLPSLSQPDFPRWWGSGELLSYKRVTCAWWSAYWCHILYCSQLLCKSKKHPVWLLYFQLVAESRERLEEFCILINLSQKACLVYPLSFCPASNKVVPNGSQCWSCTIQFLQTLTGMCLCLRFSVLLYFFFS